MDVVSVQQLVRMWADGQEAGQSSGLNELGRLVLWSGMRFLEQKCTVLVSLPGSYVVAGKGVT